MVGRPELWEALLITRFGEASLQSSSLNSTALRAMYVKKSRTTLPALEIGVGTDVKCSQLSWQMYQLGW